MQHIMRQLFFNVLKSAKNKCKGVEVTIDYLGNHPNDMYFDATRINFTYIISYVSLVSYS